jgi:ketosteroid isomerase-like protein
MTTNRLSRAGCAALMSVLLCASACAREPVAADADVIAVVESFYSAMKAGNVADAMRVMAPDAVFLESGGLETRAQYESNHLPADIDFEKQVAGKRGPWTVRFDGNTAWMHALTEYQGTFKDAPVNFASAQLVVLTRAASNPWQIQAIHWSSRRR